MAVSNIIHASLLSDLLGQNQRINHKYEYKINTCHGCRKKFFALFPLRQSLAGLAEEYNA